MAVTSLLAQIVNSDTSSDDKGEDNDDVDRDYDGIDETVKKYAYHIITATQQLSDIFHDIPIVTKYFEEYFVKAVKLDLDLIPPGYNDIVLMMGVWKYYAIESFKATIQEDWGKYYAILNQLSNIAKTISDMVEARSIGSLKFGGNLSPNTHY